jgi:carbon monoxide dehydrogenase subunit G
MVELAGEYEFAAPQELVWEMMLNPEILSLTIAGCEKLERVDESTLHGRLNLRVGPVQGIFQGKVESTDVHAPSSLRMIVSGSGPAGVVRGEGNITLEAMPTTTRLRYDGAVQVSGRIASVGQRVMDSSAKSIVKQSLQNLEKHIQARLEPELKLDPGAETVIAPTAPAIPGAPSQTEFMFNVARDVIHDLVPDAGRRRVVVGVGVAVVVIGLINGFANLVARRVAKILREEWS